MDPETVQKLLKAGKIAAQVRRETAAKLEKPGCSYLQAMDFAEERIVKLGGQIAWAQMALNDVAAHFCPEEDDTQISQEGQLIKVDIGVHLDGWIADNAMTVEVGKSKEYADFIKASQNALKATLKLLRPGTPLWQLGEAQSSEAEALGLKTIRNLCGHTLEQYKVHAGISVPTFNNKDKTELQEGWQVAIEPFITDGQGYIKEKGKATVFMVEKEKGVRSPYARKILEEVRERNGLPFTTRWLTRKFGKGGAALGLRELQQTQIIKPYPPLGEVSGRMIAQFEHSTIVKDKPLVYTRHEEDGW